MKHVGARLLLVTALVGGGLAVLPATAQAAEVTAALVKTTQTGRNSAWAAQGHPSPDPSGIAYNSRTGQLIISDGEVDERTSSYPNNVWNGTNLFVASLDGTLVETGLDTERFSPEPTGVGFRPDNPATAANEERLFVSDDDAFRIFEVSHGGDGKYGNTDDTWTSTSVRFADTEADAEDVAVDLELTRNGQLLLIDGLGQRVFILSPGPDGAFDGVGDTVTRQFDVAALGAVDPEGIAYNRFRDTIFVLDDGSNRIYEYNMVGQLQNTVVLPFRTGSAAGLALAPPSGNPTGAPNAYIVDRGVDNDTVVAGDPTAFNDGRMYEVSIPGLTGNGGGTTTPPPPPPGSGVLDIPVRASSDDAEQRSSSVNLSSGDLNLVADGSTVQTIGMRFTGVNLPRGATITNAYVQFQVDEVSTAAASLTVAGQNAGNAATFTAAAGDVGNRPRTTATAAWSPASWPTANARTEAQRTGNLAPVVQQIVNRADWASGNALALIVTGTGTRTAESFDGGAAKAPVLHIEYGSSTGGGGTTNAAPTVNAGPDSSVVRPNAATLSGSVTDDGQPAGSTVTARWSQVSGPGTAAFANANAASTTATFPAAGTYVLRLTGSDGTLSATDDVQVTVTDGTTTPPPTGTGVLDIPVRAGSDDAEQRSSTGAVNLSSGDLNLALDGTAAQTIGMRFTGVNLPRGATITNAYVQFQVDEVSTGAANLTFAGQATDSATTFAAVAGDIGNRPRTTATVAWAPGDWPTANARTVAQRTGNLAPVVQEIVNRAGWASGNALALIVSGSGTRIAESFDGGAAKAPVLHIEYRVG